MKTENNEKPAVGRSASNAGLGATKQPYLDGLFKAAVDCTGDWMPGNWESKGRLHLAGLCGDKCKAPN